MMIKKWDWLCAGLSVLVTISAVMVVHGKYESRLLFNEVHRLQAQLEAMEVEWEQLLLEEHAFADPARIEHLARTRLQMRVPKADEILYVPRLRQAR